MYVCTTYICRCGWVYIPFLSLYSVLFLFLITIVTNSFPLPDLTQSDPSIAYAPKDWMFIPYFTAIRYQKKRNHVCSFLSHRNRNPNTIPLRGQYSFEYVSRIHETNASRMVYFDFWRVVAKPPPLERHSAIQAQKNWLRASFEARNNGIRA